MARQTAAKVLIADSQRLLSGALAAVLARKFKFDVVEDRPAAGGEVMQAVISNRPDVVLLDYWLDQGALTRQIKEALPGCKVIVMSGIYGPDHVQQAVSAGAAGFLPKSAGIATVADAIRQAAEGRSLVYADELTAMVDKMGERHRAAEDFTRRLQSLSARETQVLVLLGKGRLIQDIARDLTISPPTVTGHINRILKKTGARSQAEVLAMARVAGVIQT